MLQAAYIRRVSVHDFHVMQDRLSEEGFVVCDGCPAYSPHFLLEVAASVGSLDLEIDEELSGSAIMSIKHDPIKALRVDRPTYFSRDVFPLHTDLSYVVNPPRFVLILCLTADPAGGGLITLTDCQQAWNSITNSDKTELGTRQFRFRNPPNTPEDDAGLLPVSYSTPQWHMWRWRLDSMTFPAHSAEAVQNFAAILEQTGVSFGLSSGELLIVDNHRMTHGRTAFDSGSSRHLLRSYAQDSDRSVTLRNVADSGWP